MILMAIEHANLFIAQKFSPTPFWFGTQPHYHNFLNFFTRYLPHITAPGFFFLMGIGMTLYENSRKQLGWSSHYITRRFIIRGCILILLQFIVLNPIWGIQLDHVKSTRINFGIFYGLGAAMLASAFLIRLPSALIIILSLTFALSIEALLPDPSQASLKHSLVKQLLYLPVFRSPIFVTFPLLPWLSITSFGIIYGRWILKTQSFPKKGTPLIALLFCVLFIWIHFRGGYGNILPATGSGFDALNIIKYPPSVAFILITLSSVLFILTLLSYSKNFFSRRMPFFINLGQNALTFYFLHMFLFALLGRLFFPNGTSLIIMYPICILVIVCVYPLCRRFGQFKRNHPPESIWRFF